MASKRSCIIIVCIVVITVPLVLYEFSTYSPFQGQNVAWQSSLDHFAGDFTAADGKVFVTDGSIHCFDASNGRLLWNVTGGYGAISVSDGKVYVGTYGSIVKRLDENTGNLETQIEIFTPYYDKTGYIPTFFVTDGRVFTESSAYNAANGELLWSNNYYSHLTINKTSVTLPKSEYVIIESGSYLTERIDPNNGNILWKISGYSSEDPVVTNTRVILWNLAANSESIPPDEHSIVCLEKENGRTIWNFSTQSKVFRPTVTEKMVMFGSEDGYFYALDLADGSLKWKTFVDIFAVIQTYRSQYQHDPTGMYIEANQPIVDTDNQHVYWDIFTSDKNSKYSGAIISLDLQSGNRTWITPITSSAVYTRNEYANMALLGNRVFVSANKDLYCVETLSGNVIWKNSFDHSLNLPIKYNDKVFVTADLKVMAYK